MATLQEEEVLKKTQFFLGVSSREKSARKMNKPGVGVGRTRVGKYELGRTLGEGTFAKVKFARNVETGEEFAIKILDKDKILKHKMIDQVSLFLSLSLSLSISLPLSPSLSLAKVSACRSNAKSRP